MSELTITEVEIAKELPGWQGKGAKVFRYTVEGDTRRPEDFVVNGTEPKKPGDTIEGIEDGEYGPKIKKQQRRQGGGGFGKSPTQEKRIVRQHSQEMALMREANLVAGGKGNLQSDELRRLIQWFENDAYGKVRGVEADPMTSDVPGDLSDTPFGGTD
jgi:hypothetical protein